MTEPIEQDGGATLVMQIPTVSELPLQLTRLPPREAAKLLMRTSDAEAARALALVNPALTVDILRRLPLERQQRIAAADKTGRGDQWLKDEEHAAGTVGRMMDRPLAVFTP